MSHAVHIVQTSPPGSCALAKMTLRTEKLLGPSQRGQLFRVLADLRCTSLSLKPSAAAQHTERATPYSKLICWPQAWRKSELDTTMCSLVLCCQQQTQAADKGAVQKRGRSASRLLPALQLRRRLTAQPSLLALRLAAAALLLCLMLQPPPLLPPPLPRYSSLGPADCSLPDLDVAVAPWQRQLSRGILLSKQLARFTASLHRLQPACPDVTMQVQPKASRVGHSCAGSFKTFEGYLRGAHSRRSSSAPFHVLLSAPY